MFNCDVTIPFEFHHTETHARFRFRGKVAAVSTVHLLILLVKLDSSLFAGEFFQYYRSGTPGIEQGSGLFCRAVVLYDRYQYFREAPLTLLSDQDTFDLQ